MKKIIFFVVFISILFTFAACLQSEELIQSATAQPDVTTTFQIDTSTTETKKSTEEATTSGANGSQKEVAATKKSEEHTTRVYSETMNQEISKNQEAFSQHFSVWSAEFAATTLYSLGVQEIIELSIREEMLFDSPEAKYLLARIVDSENQVYHITMDMKGYVGLIYKGEPVEKNLIYSR